MIIILLSFAVCGLLVLGIRRVSIAFISSSEKNFLKSPNHISFFIIYVEAIRFAVAMADICYRFAHSSNDFNSSN